MIEIGLPQVVGLLAALSACVGILWKVVLDNAARERARSTSSEAALLGLREAHIELIQEVAHMRGFLEGERVLATRVLDHIEKLGKNAENRNGNS